MRFPQAIGHEKSTEVSAYLPGRNIGYLLSGVDGIAHLLR